VSADFLISSNIAVGVSIAYITGAMDKVDVNGEDVDLSEKENLNRLDASGGLKFFFMMPD
jgi:hypothetical protein